MPEAAHPTPLEQYLDKVIIISHFTLIGFAFFSSNYDMSHRHTTNEPRFT